MSWRERCNSPLRLGKRYLVLSWAVTLFGKASSSIESGQADIYHCVMSWGSGRSLGEVNDNLLRYACLGNPMDRGACWTTIHGITKSQTRLSRHMHAHTHICPGGFFFAYFSSFFYSTGLLNACCPLSLLTSCPKMLTGGRQTIVEGLLLCYFLYAHWPHENSKAFLLNRI